MGVSSQRHVPAALYPRERIPVPIGQEAGWASKLVWTQRLRKKILCLCRGSNHRLLVVQSVAKTTLTELPHLLQIWPAGKLFIY
jgi:hypothetical protein